MKYLIFDSGPLINFSLNGLLPLFKKIKKEFNGEFLISPSVKKETIDYPETVKRFELEALQLKELFNEGIIRLPKLTESQRQELEKVTNELIHMANSTYSAKGKNIEIIDLGEATTLALSIILKNDLNAIVIDERTTRMLCENPENLRKLFEKKLHTKVTTKEQNYSFFKGFKIIRSTELVYLAYKRGLVELKDPQTLDALLYAMKYNGCSISENEIEEMKTF